MSCICFKFQHFKKIDGWKHLLTICLIIFSFPDQTPAQVKQDQVTSKEVSGQQFNITPLSEFKKIGVLTPNENEPGGYGALLNQEKFYECLGYLPKEMASINQLFVNADNLGKYWALNTEKYKVVFDQEAKKIIFQTTDAGTLRISPHGKYAVLKTESDSSTGGPGDTILDISSMNKIVTPESGFHVSLEHFLGNDSLVFGISNRGSGGEVLDLDNGSFVPKNGDEVPVGFRTVEMPNKKLLLAPSFKKKGMSFFGIPSLNETQNFPELCAGIPFVSQDGSIIGSHDGDNVCFYNLTTHQTFIIGISLSDKNILILSKAGKVTKHIATGDIHGKVIEEVGTVPEYIYDLRASGKKPFDKKMEISEKVYRASSKRNQEFSGFENVIPDTRWYGILDFSKQLYKQRQEWQFFNYFC